MKEDKPHEDAKSFRGRLKKKMEQDEATDEATDDTTDDKK